MKEPGASCWTVMALCGFILPLRVLGQPMDEQFYGYLGNYPKNANPGWHENAQGIAHDDDHWFITQTETIWRIPVCLDLGSVSPGGSTLRRRLSDYPALTEYNHFGDPEHFTYRGVGYLIIPIEGPGRCGGVAIFLGRTLDYVTKACLPGQSHSSWCAVESDGVVVSSEYDNAAALRRYYVDWAAVELQQPIQPSFLGLLSLSTESGESLTLNAVQGGAISPISRIIYLVADGIHVFNSAGRRVQRSVNGLPSTPGYFRYEYDTSVGEEPEGLTIWDLDNSCAPNIRGQLHVVLLDNNLITADNVFLKHYSRELFVDRTHSSPQHGSFENPFATVSAANTAAWPGAHMIIKAGFYPETLTFSKSLSVMADGGNVTIGR